MDHVLAPGTRLGPYEIEELIGSGGMGRVYRAHDPRLSRHVAIKTITTTVTNDTEQRQRGAHLIRVNQNAEGSLCVAAVGHGRCAGVGK